MNTILLAVAHWTWWQGALALSLVATGYAWTEGSPMGVSGKFGRVLEQGALRLDSLMFLAAILLGAFLALPSTPKAPAFLQTLYPSPLLAGLALVGGGLLVGLGTRISGGCTSGHGLCGSARGNPPSLVATAVFFGTAIAVSLILGAAA